MTGGDIFCNSISLLMETFHGSWRQVSTTSSPPFSRIKVEGEASVAKNTMLWFLTWPRNSTGQLLDYGVWATNQLCIIILEMYWTSLESGVKTETFTLLFDIAYNANLRWRWSSCMMICAHRYRQRKPDNDAIFLPAWGSNLGYSGFPTIKITVIP